MKKLSVLIALALVAATAVQADVLANWNNEALVAGATAAPVANTHADVASSDLTFGAGLQVSNYPEALTSYAHTLFTSLSAAVTGNDYFTFTVTPDASKLVSYSDLYLRYTLQANAYPATTQWTLMSSLTGFTASDGLDTLNVTASASGANYGEGTFDLSGVSGLQNVAAGTPVEFRMYAHNTSGTMTRMGVGEAWGPDRDDMTLNGTVVPEPATLSLFGFVAGGMLWIRKRFAA